VFEEKIKGRNKKRVANDEKIKLSWPDTQINRKQINPMIHSLTTNSKDLYVGKRGRSILIPV
jgi:hypothetical protein